MYFIVFTGKQSCITKESMERCEKRSFYSVYQRFITRKHWKVQNFKNRNWQSNGRKPDCKCTFQAINQHRLKHEVSWNQKSCFSMYGQKLVRLSHLASETSYSVETQAKGRGRNLQQFIFKGLMLTFHEKNLERPRFYQFLLESFSSNYNTVSIMGWQPQSTIYIWDSPSVEQCFIVAKSGA